MSRCVAHRDGSQRILYASTTRLLDHHRFACGSPVVERQVGVWKDEERFPRWPLGTQGGTLPIRSIQSSTKESA